MNTSIQIMHIREVVSKNYSPWGNFIKVWNTRGWKPSVFFIFIKLPRVDNFTNDRSPNVHYLFYRMVSKIWAVVSKKKKKNARSRHRSITHRTNDHFIIRHTRFSWVYLFQYSKLHFWVKFVNSKKMKLQDINATVVDVLIYSSLVSHHQQ